MEITIQSSDAPAVDWGATGTDEIAQNVFTLINTYKYEVAYDRTLGIRRDFVDQPLPVAIPLAIAQIYSVIEEREPRAKVKDVSFLSVDKDGNMAFKVVIDI